MSQQFLTSVVSVSADCGLLMKCKVIQSILIYMSCNHTCSRTELLERQIIYFVSSLHEMSVCILLQWEPFFHVVQKQVVLFFPTVFYRSLKIIFPDPSPHCTSHTPHPPFPYLCRGLSQATPLRQSRTAIKIVPQKNGQGDNLPPSQFREKTQKEAHTKRFSSVQKLKAKTERGKYILSHL